MVWVTEWNLRWSSSTPKFGRNFTARGGTDGFPTEPPGVLQQYEARLLEKAFQTNRAGGHSDHADAEPHLHGTPRDLYGGSRELLLDPPGGAQSLQRACVGKERQKLVPAEPGGLGAGGQALPQPNDRLPHYLVAGVPAEGVLDLREVLELHGQRRVRPTGLRPHQLAVQHTLEAPAVPESGKGIEEELELHPDVGVLQIAGHQLQGPLRAEALHGVTQRTSQLAAVEFPLDEVVLGAPAQGLESGFGVVGARQHHDGKRFLPLPETFKGFQALNVGQRKVEDHRVGASLLQEVEGLGEGLAVDQAQDTVLPGIAEDLLEKTGVRGVVLHEKEGSGVPGPGPGTPP